MEKQRENFGGRAAVIMAFAGSAIGLGNIWRFPYMVGENGGAAFILIYIAATLLLSLPIFLAESVIGRRSGQNAIGAMKTLAPGSGWRILGYLSILTPMIIVSYYSVVGGWSLEYLWQACRLRFTAIPADVSSGLFNTFITSTWGPLACHTVFLLMGTVIVAAGVKSGIEKFCKVSIPILFVLVVLIMLYSLSLPGAGAGVQYLLKPDFSKLTPRACAAALGQSFFSLSLGMGIIITYSSYIRRDENLLASGVGTAVADLLFALLAGFAIMPAVFAGGIQPSAGPGLIFQTLPYIFTQMGIEMPVVSAVVAILFFLTVLVAALTSTVSLLEVGVAWLVEEKHLRRGWACWIIFGGTWLLGALCSLSFGPLSRFQLGGKVLFDLLDLFSSNFLLILGGLLGVLFVGWKMPRSAVRDEFSNGGRLRGNARLFGAFYFILKYLAPLAILVIFVTNFL